MSRSPLTTSAVLLLAAFAAVVDVRKGSGANSLDTVRNESADEMGRMKTRYKYAHKGMSKFAQATKIPLCFSKPSDLGKEIIGSVEHAPPPTGEPFTIEGLERFPYVSAGYCRNFNQPLQLVPTNCRLPDFDPLSFLQLIKGHRLIFWGDSVTRQFFFYITLRIEGFRDQDQERYGGTAATLPEADPEKCREYKSSSKDFHLDRECFDIPPRDIADDRGCIYYLNQSAAICFVRAERRIIDNRNVVYWNALKEDDIILMNIGLHHNTERLYHHQLAGFVRLVAYYKARYHKLPLMMFRETSAQHFEGGIGGNFPGQSQEHMDALHDVDPDIFRCKEHSFEVMKNTNWRNDALRKPGFRDRKLRMHIPILRIWNTTALGASFHPRTLGGRSAEAQATATADCTHFCPSFGGIFEIWSTLLQNNLKAAQPLQQTLRPTLSNYRTTHQIRQLPEQSDINDA